jgi:putative ABC transport system permease protein
MTKFYLKIPSRNKVRHKQYSSINKLELAIGMAVCILLLLWVRGELYSAQLLEKQNNLYRIVQGGLINQDEQYGNLKVPYGPAPILEVTFHKYKLYSRLHTFDGVKLINNITYFSNNRLFQAKPALLKMFSFPFIKGDEANVLHKLHSHVITREAAKQNFSDEYPSGKVVNVHNKSDFTITGLVENNPRNSSIDLSFVAPFSLSGKEQFGGWSRESFTHVILKNNIVLSDSNHTIISIMNNGRFICAK